MNATYLSLPRITTCLSLKGNLKYGKRPHKKYHLLISLLCVCIYSLKNEKKKEAWIKGFGDWLQVECSQLLTETDTFELGHDKYNAIWTSSLWSAVLETRESKLKYKQLSKDTRFLLLSTSLFSKSNLLSHLYFVLHALISHHSF